MTNPTQHHFQFVAACIEKAISLGYEYDQEKSLQVIHEEAKEYIKNVGEPVETVEGWRDENWLCYRLGMTNYAVYIPDDRYIHITDDGTLYRIECTPSK